MPENWKPVPGFPGYEASDQGRIRSFFDWRVRRPVRILANARDSEGYIVVRLQRGSRAIPRKVHTIILETFVGPCPKGYQCDHINGKRDDNRLENLHWVTPRENTMNPVTQRRHNRPARPVRCLDTQVVYPSAHEAARALGLVRSSINRVCNGVWKQTGGFQFAYEEEVRHA